jgi:hypothetical protein
MNLESLDNLLLLLQGSNESTIEKTIWSVPETNGNLSRDTVALAPISSEHKPSPVCAKLLSPGFLRTGSHGAPRSGAYTDISNLLTEDLRLSCLASSKPVDIKKFARASRSASEIDEKEKWKATERVCSSFKSIAMIQSSTDIPQKFVPAWKRKSIEEILHLRARRQAAKEGSIFE